MRRILVLFLIAFFAFGFNPQEQKEKQRGTWGFYLVCVGEVCILPPLTSKTLSPPKRFSEDFRKFYNLYIENLKNLLDSSQLENLWWVLVLLRPKCENKGWCIEIDVAEERRDAEHVLITQVFLSEKEGFDVEAAAGKAAKKTKAKILSGKKLRKASAQPSARRFFL